MLHRPGDALFPVGGGALPRRPDAGVEAVELDGADHFVAGDPDQILDAIEPFVAAMQSRSHPRWHSPHWCFLRSRRESVVTRHLIESGGRRRHTASGDVVVLFDGPATAYGQVSPHSTKHPTGGSAWPSPRSRSTAGRSRTPESTMPCGWVRAAPGELRVSDTAAVLFASSDIQLERLDSAVRVRLHAPEFQARLSSAERAGE